MIRFFIIIFSLLFLGCSQPENGYAQSQTYTTNTYDLVIPAKQKGLLILFPCFPCDAKNTTTEFGIDDLAVDNHFAVLKMNLNMRLWLSESEKNALEFSLLNIIKKYELNTKNTYIGGFSSGGNVSLLITDHLKKNKSALQPKGVFIVDSPIDLLGLYKNAQDNIKKDYSEVAINEANWIVSTFDKTFGVGDTSLVHYENKSPYSSESHKLTNLSNLDKINIRMYSEPDTLWWKKERGTPYEQMNAYYIGELYKDLTTMYGSKRIEYVTTKGKGYRANGDRHPHSWSIVDKKKLIEWMK